ncbi:MAG: hypothetical protein QM679_11350, partial [Patulibacter sp.]
MVAAPRPPQPAESEQQHGGLGGKYAAKTTKGIEKLTDATTNAEKARNAEKTGNAVGRDTFPDAIDRPAHGFHYTRSELVRSIEINGLRPGAFVTTTGELKPLQAQIDLALPPNRGLPGAVIRVDLAAMRRDGI